MRKIRSDKGKTHRRFADEIEREMFKQYSEDFWMNPKLASDAYKEAVRSKDWSATKARIRGYMEENDMTAKEAVSSFANSQIYKTREDRIAGFIYNDIRKQKGWVLGKKNIKYKGKIEHDGESFYKYEVSAYNQTFFVYEYKDNSPTDGSIDYQNIITKESW